VLVLPAGIAGTAGRLMLKTEKGGLK